MGDASDAVTENVVNTTLDIMFPTKRTLSNSSQLKTTLTLVAVLVSACSSDGESIALVDEEDMENGTPTATSSCDEILLLGVQLMQTWLIRLSVQCLGFTVLFPVSSLCVEG